MRKWTVLIVGVLSLAALIVVLLMRRPAPEPSDGAMASTGSVPVVPSRESKAAPAAPKAPRAEELVEPASTAPAKTFELNSQPLKLPADKQVKEGREFAKEQWDAFVAKGHPTEAQKQALLSAIYDGQLQFAQLRKAQDDWNTQESERPNDPRLNHEYPMEDWRTQQGDVDAVVQKVLTPEQYRIYWVTLRPAMDSAIISEFVASRPGS